MTKRDRLNDSSMLQRRISAKTMKILYFTILFILYSFFSSAEIINDVVVNNNKRISKETVIALGNIKIGTNYDKSDVDQVLKNLYETDFFSCMEYSP